MCTFGIGVRYCRSCGLMWRLCCCVLRPLLDLRPRAVVRGSGAGTYLGCAVPWSATGTTVWPVRAGCGVPLCSGWGVEVAQGRGVPEEEPDSRGWGLLWRREREDLQGSFHVLRTLTPVAEECGSEVEGVSSVGDVGASGLHTQFFLWLPVLVTISSFTFCKCTYFSKNKSKI